MAFKITACVMLALISGILIQSLVTQRVSASYSSYYYRYQNPFSYWFVVFCQSVGAVSGVFLVLWAFLI